VASGNDVVTPSNKVALLYKEERWPGAAAAGGELWPIYACTSCGRCSDYCLYDVPVGDLLVLARQEFRWGPAEQAKANLDRKVDPCGDLAAELGDWQLALRRAKEFGLAAGARGQALELEEPQSAYFFQEHRSELGVGEGRWAWRGRGYRISEEVRAKLNGAPQGAPRRRRWLVVESPWASRRLGFAQEIHEALAREDQEWVWPFQSGSDSIDVGGEGVFGRLFPEIAARMARDVWERDAGRADGIACMSERAAKHLRLALPDVEVVNLASPGFSQVRASQ